MIQKHVITNDVHDHWSKQYQCERHKLVREQQQATDDLQDSDNPIIVRKEERADELPTKSSRHRPHAEKIQKTIEAKQNKDQPNKMRAIKITIFILLILSIL